MKKILRIGLPSGGRLAEESMELFRTAQIPIQRASPRSNSGKGLRWSGLSVSFIRPTDVARMVRDGALNCGITAENIIREIGGGVNEVLKLGFGNCRVVVAAPEGTNLADLQAKRIATSYPNTAKNFFDSKKMQVDIFETPGAVEAFPSLDLVPPVAGIVDITETGTSLRENNLKILADILSSQAILVANTELSSGLRGMVDFIRLSLEGAIEARKCKKVTCFVPNNEKSIADFMAIYDFYADEKRKYVMNLHELSRDADSVVFTFLCDDKSVSKIMYVLSNGRKRSPDGPILNEVEGIKIELSEIRLLIK